MQSHIQAASVYCISMMRSNIQCASYQEKTPSLKPRTFLARTQETQRKLLKDNSTATQAHPQRAITTFFSPITPNSATNQSRATQMGIQLEHNQEMNAIISHHCRCFPCFRDLSILIQPMLEIFQ